MSIIITGSSGFIGRHLLNYLAKKLPKSKLYALHNTRLPISNKKILNLSNTLLVKNLILI